LEYSALVLSRNFRLPHIIGVYPHRIWVLKKRSGNGVPDKQLLGHRVACGIIEKKAWWILNRVSRLTGRPTGQRLRVAAFHATPLGIRHWKGHGRVANEVIDTGVPKQAHLF